MKKMLEPPMPVTFWMQAVVQMLAFVVYVLVLAPQAIFPSVQLRLGQLEESVGWGLPFVLWIVFILLVGELCTRLTQRAAATLVPFHYLGFAGLQILMLIPILVVTFVGLECVLFFVAMGRYPLVFGNIFFEQGFVRTLEVDAPVAIIFLVGEALRHIVYGGAIQKWHHDRGLRLKPQAFEE